MQLTQNFIGLHGISFQSTKKVIIEDSSRFEIKGLRQEFETEGENCYIVYFIYLNYYFSDEDEGLEDVARCMVPIIGKHSKSIDVDSDCYQKVLGILQKESGPRFSVMKEDMNSMKEGGKGKSYSYKTHVEKHIRKLFCNLCLGL